MTNLLSNVSERADENAFSASPPSSDGGATLSAGEFDRELHQRSMRREINERRRMPARLLSAVKKKALVLRYQPLYSLRSSNIVGGELQIRLHNARRGSIPVHQFLHLVDKTDVIDEVFLWELETVCGDIAAWPGSLAGVSHDLPALF